MADRAQIGSVEPPRTKKCSRCKYRGPPESFPRKRNLEYHAKCQACLDSTAKHRENQRAAKDNPESSGAKKTRPGPAIHATEREEMDWESIIDLLEKNKKHPCELDVIAKLNVFVEELELEDPENGVIARRLTRAIYESTGYRYMYVFSFACLQYCDVYSDTRICKAVVQPTRSRPISSSVHSARARKGSNTWLMTQRSGEVG